MFCKEWQLGKTSIFNNFKLKMSMQKTNVPYYNSEFMRGFVEATMENCDDLIGPFKSDLADYGIDFTPQQSVDGDFRINIPYAIIGDNRADLMAKVDIRLEDTIHGLKVKVERAIEEICETVKEFKRG